MDASILYFILLRSRDQSIIVIIIDIAKNILLTIHAEQSNCYTAFHFIEDNSFRCANLCVARHQTFFLIEFHIIAFVDKQLKCQWRLTLYVVEIANRITFHSWSSLKSSTWIKARWTITRKHFNAMHHLCQHTILHCLFGALV